VVTDLRKKATMLATMLERARELCQGSLDFNRENEEAGGYR
jgi:hypothetical protein